MRDDDESNGEPKRIGAVTAVESHKNKVPIRVTCTCKRHPYFAVDLPLQLCNPYWVLHGNGRVKLPVAMFSCGEGKVGLEAETGEAKSAEHRDEDSSR